MPSRWVAVSTRCSTLPSRQWRVSLEPHSASARPHHEPLVPIHDIAFGIVTQPLQ